MFNIILYQPEIPPNTGNVIRLCANTGSHLHLIKPLGFSMDDYKLRRAGLDYHEFASIKVYESLNECLEAMNINRLFAFSTRGKSCFSQIEFQIHDNFIFGPETRGLPQIFLDSLPQEQILRIPMMPDNRSLNLSNAVSVVVYEAWRQLEFQGAI